ncbi:hypothetical protein [Catellatospora bangladeshensis]|uniref:Uncharacterized protein n=1 Tax=Catellatospora bangladeshensis TaxID=310355 RepID=A0A8J3NHW3_9ACTN|nr:hypothetical protein [Catellatospora bangladeshensis]GIF81820.1 hypothetical protein Cba03nite_31690 [Catellatospora bangladeshensis]
MNEQHEPDGRLEWWYTRLLALFPPGHRAEYGDEMLGVLLAGTRPGQRLPRLGEAADLMGSAVWMRLGGRGAGAVDSRWADTAAVYGLVASLLLVLAPARYVAADMLYAARLDGMLLRPSTGVLVSMLLWGLAAAAACTRWSVVSAGLAWAGAAHQVWLLAAAYPEQPELLVRRWWMVVLMLSAAFALSVRGRVRGGSVLGGVRTGVLAVALTVLTVLPAVEVLLAETSRHADGGYEIASWGGYQVKSFLGEQPVHGALSAALEAACVLALLGCLIGLAPAVRRRLPVLGMPALLVLVTVPSVFEGFLMSTVRFDPPVLLAAGEWAYLVLLPLLTLLVGVVLLERAERHAHLVGLGLAAEREALLRRTGAAS